MGRLSREMMVYARWGVLEWRNGIEKVEGEFFDIGVKLL